MVETSAVWNTVKQIGAEFSEKNVTFMAAGIAYNAFISLAPLLLLLLIAVSTLGSGLESRIVAMAQNSLPGPIADVVAQVFEDNSASSGASIVGLVVLVWGTLKIFRGLDTAFSEIYETTSKNSFVDKLIDGFVVLVAIAIAITATVAVSAVFARFEDAIPYLGLVTPLVLVFGLILAFTPMYYRFPDVDVDWDHVFPGVVFAAVGWAIFQSLFQVYLSFTGGSTGSIFGGVVVVITWLYFSGLVLLLGAVINAVLGDHSSGKAGGVGQGASGYETNREDVMDRDEVAGYLADLRVRLADDLGDSRPPTGPEDTRHLSEPDGGVEVIEQSKTEGEDREWTVAFRWHSLDGDSNDRSDPADD